MARVSLFSAMVSAVIVAAGSGKRFGPEADKLFLDVAGQPVIAHTWARFDRSPWISEVVVVTRAGMEGAFEEMARELNLSKPWRLVPGGKERQDSVWNGLQATPPECEVAVIHDGARPCVSGTVIADVIRAARETGAAVTAQRVTDSLKESADGVTIARSVDRSRLWSVQTPQAFRREVLVRALEEARRQGLNLTDDTAACECIGRPVRLVESREPNPKITYPGDLPYLEWLLARGAKNVA